MSVQQAGTGIRVPRELEEFPAGGSAVRAPFAALRARRGIPGGPLAHRSGHEPVPLGELERMPVLGAMAGTTGWHFSITRDARYAPHVSGQRPGPRPGVQGLRRPAGAVRLRHVRQGSRDGAVCVHHELRPGSSPGPRFYDRFFKPGAYLRTHAEHMQRWARRAGRENDRWASTYARGPWTCGSSAREPVRTSCSSQG